MRMKSKLLILAFLTFAVSAWADVKLHNLFTDDMVLQRDATVSVWGWADADEEVTVEFRDQHVKAKSKDGKWMAKLKPLKAGGPDQLTVKAAKKGQPEQTVATLSRVLVGEVWIASGQSNMEWPLRASYEAEKDISSARNPQMRLYTVPKLKAESPRDNIDARWVECSPETVPSFSAVAYYFARDLQKALG